MPTMTTRLEIYSTWRNSSSLEITKTYASFRLQLPVPVYAMSQTQRTTRCSVPTILVGGVSQRTPVNCSKC
jgi:hypothetical protein